MLRIVHTRGRRAPAVEQFAELPIRLGCAPGNHVLFQAGTDPGVMAQHAEIRLENGAFWLVDLGTASGTFVGGMRIMRQALKNGDVVRLGGPGAPELRVEILADAEGRVDLATAQSIIQAAVMQATRHEDKAGSIVVARVGAATRRAARTNSLLSLGVVVAFASMLVAAFFVYRSRRAAEVLAAEIGLDKHPVAPAAGTVPSDVHSGREIFEANKGALFVIGYLLPNAIGGCCTAFAVGPDLLATNAHCVLACKKRGGKPIVTQNDSGGKTRFDIVGWSGHPGYNPQSQSANSPDVGLIRVRGRLPVVVTLGSDAELRAIGPGDDAFVLGFPGRVMDPQSPSATFLSGRVGRVMGFDEEATSADKSVLIQHDAVTRGGNSGSPIFNQYGHVIAIHAAHMDEENEEQLGGQKTKVLNSSPFRIGMRIDLLKGVPTP